MKVVLWNFIVIIASAIIALGETLPCDGLNVGQGFTANIYSYPLLSPAGTSPLYYTSSYSSVGQLQATISGITNINFNVIPITAFATGKIYGFETSINNFALELIGYFLAPETGSYIFTLGNVDDGASLQIGRAARSTCCDDFDRMIDQTLTINTYLNLFHQQKIVELSKGRYYPIRIMYYNSNGVGILNLAVKFPSGITHNGVFNNVYQLETSDNCEAPTPLITTSTSPEDSSPYSTDMRPIGSSNTFKTLSEFPPFYPTSSVTYLSTQIKTSPSTRYSAHKGPTSVASSSRTPTYKGPKGPLNSFDASNHQITWPELSITSTKVISPTLANNFWANSSVITFDTFPLSISSLPSKISIRPSLGLSVKFSPASESVSSGVSSMEQSLSDFSDTLLYSMPSNSGVTIYSRHFESSMISSIHLVEASGNVTSRRVTVTSSGHPTSAPGSIFTGSHVKRYPGSNIIFQSTSTILTLRIKPSSSECQFSKPHGGGSIKTPLLNSTDPQSSYISYKLNSIVPEKPSNIDSRLLISQPSNIVSGITRNLATLSAKTCNLSGYFRSRNISVVKITTIEKGYTGNRTSDSNSIRNWTRTYKMQSKSVHSTLALKTLTKSISSGTSLSVEWSNGYATTNVMESSSRNSGRLFSSREKSGSLYRTSNLMNSSYSKTKTEPSMIDQLSVISVLNYSKKTTDSCSNSLSTSKILKTIPKDSICGSTPSKVISLPSVTACLTGKSQFTFSSSSASSNKLSTMNYSAEGSSCTNCEFQNHSGVDIPRVSSRMRSTPSGQAYINGISSLIAGKGDKTSTTPGFFSTKSGSTEGSSFGLTKSFYTSIGSLVTAPNNTISIVRGIDTKKVLTDLGNMNQSQTGWNQSSTKTLTGSAIEITNSLSRPNISGNYLSYWFISNASAKYVISEISGHVTQIASSRISDASSLMGMNNGSQLRSADFLSQQSLKTHALSATIFISSTCQRQSFKSLRTSHTQFGRTTFSYDVGRVSQGKIPANSEYRSLNIKTVVPFSSLSPNISQISLIYSSLSTHSSALFSKMNKISSLKPSDRDMKYSSSSLLSGCTATKFNPPVVSVGLRSNMSNSNGVRKSSLGNSNKLDNTATGLDSTRRNVLVLSSGTSYGKTKKSTLSESSIHSSRRTIPLKVSSCTDAGSFDCSLNTSKFFPTTITSIPKSRSSDHTTLAQSMSHCSRSSCYNNRIPVFVTTRTSRSIKTNRGQSDARSTALFTRGEISQKPFRTRSMNNHGKSRYCSEAAIIQASSIETRVKGISHNEDTSLSYPSSVKSLYSRTTASILSHSRAKSCRSKSNNISSSTATFKKITDAVSFSSVTSYYQKLNSGTASLGSHAYSSSKPKITESQQVSSIQITSLTLLRQNSISVKAYYSRNTNNSTIVSNYNPHTMVHCSSRVGQTTRLTNAIPFLSRTMILTRPSSSPPGSMIMSERERKFSEIVSDSSSYFYTWSPASKPSLIEEHTSLASDMLGTAPYNSSVSDDARKTTTMVSSVGTGGGQLRSTSDSFFTSRSGIKVTVVKEVDTKESSDILSSSFRILNLVTNNNDTSTISEVFTLTLVSGTNCTSHVSITETGTIPTCGFESSQLRRSDGNPEASISGHYTFEFNEFSNDSPDSNAYHTTFTGSVPYIPVGFSYHESSLCIGYSVSASGSLPVPSGKPTLKSEGRRTPENSSNDTLKVYTANGSSRDSHISILAIIIAIGAL